MKHPEIAAQRTDGETYKQRLFRKAAAIRRALIIEGVVVSPDADKSFSELPEYRQNRWLAVATAYVEQF